MPGGLRSIVMARAELSSGIDFSALEFRCFAGKMRHVLLQRLQFRLRFAHDSQKLKLFDARVTAVLCYNRLRAALLGYTRIAR